eukprot:Skav225814  [mRNA]  locus=scaffold4730:86041:89725:- [translate_table: standard]
MSEGPGEVFSIASSGRKFPELHARLAELSAKLTEYGASADPYSKQFAGVDTHDAKKLEEIQPYHDLDPDRIKLHGAGHWDIADWLEDNFVMPYRNPKVLYHGGGVTEKPHIRDPPWAVAALAKQWGKLGVLLIHKDPVDPDALTRIFGATKDSEIDRQIGDRRAQNSKEGKVQGPSKDLPTGPDLCSIYVNPRTHRAFLSITDRKDFYHQIKVTRSKAIANTIGPAIPDSMLQDTPSFSHFLIGDSRRKYDRKSQGDRLGSISVTGVSPPSAHSWVAFASILQGDHAGVELATQAHTNLLKDHKLLSSEVQARSGVPWRSMDEVQGLVIDDFFAISVEEKDVERGSSKAASAYAAAQKAYEDKRLLGSPHKDLIAEDEGRVVGAYLNSAPRALNRGLVTLGGPIRKRLSLAYLTMQVCQLSHTTDSLHLCLVGGWVSLLGYRRPMMSILNHSFALVDMSSYDRDNPKIIPLPRKVADELVLVATLMPLAVTELSADFDSFIYCADASNTHGAALRAPASRDLCEVLWKSARGKGSYAKILTPLQVALKRLDALEEVDIASLDEKGPEKPLAFSYEFLEVFAGAAKVSKEIEKLGITPGLPLDLSESTEYDLTLAHVMCAEEVRLNVSDDPTRHRTLRDPVSSGNPEDLSRDEMFDLASCKKLRRWASNWVRLVWIILGPGVVKLSDRSIYPLPWPCNNPITDRGGMDFDATLGYPGEIRKAAERSQRPALPTRRPVTAATTSLRESYWQVFLAWTAEEDIEVGDAEWLSALCRRVELSAHQVWACSLPGWQKLQSICRDDKRLSRQETSSAAPLAGRLGPGIQLDEARAIDSPRRHATADPDSDDQCLFALGLGRAWRNISSGFWSYAAAWRNSTGYSE